MSDKTPHDTLWDLIKDIKFGMFVHRHPNGMMHAHPLTVQNKKLDDCLLYTSPSPRDS